jgi:hypothetical protein
MVGKLILTQERDQVASNVVSALENELGDGLSEQGRGFHAAPPSWVAARTQSPSQNVWCCVPLTTRTVPVVGPSPKTDHRVSLPPPDAMIQSPTLTVVP